MGTINHLPEVKVVRDVNHSPDFTRFSQTRVAVTDLQEKNL